jgi:alpha-D-ribose 1-methylphosphonate 5-triphosphate synthase subunit PhnH
MIAAEPAIASGFAAPSIDAQRIFRRVMWAMAKPGRPSMLEVDISPPPPLGAGAAAILLALADFETAIWLDSPLADAAGVASFVRFHTGAKIVADPAEAAFAVIADPVRMPPLSAFRQGTIDYPDRSTTLIVQVERLGEDGFLVDGPGIDGPARLSAAPLPTDVSAQLADNRAAFPCGVDLLLVAGRTIAALPRSARVHGAAACT